MSKARVRIALGAMLIAALTACKPTPTAVKLSSVAGADPLLARASFDLACPEAEVQTVYVDERSQGARGCGRQARYVRSCPRCQWQRDGEIVHTGDPSREAPPARP